MRTRGCIKWKKRINRENEKSCKMLKCQFISAETELNEKENILDSRSGIGLR